MINKITRRIDRTLRKNGIDLTKLLRPFHLSQKRKFENQLRLLKQQQGQDRSFIFSKNRPIFHEDQQIGRAHV